MSRTQRIDAAVRLAIPENVLAGLRSAPERAALALMVYQTEILEQFRKVPE